MYVGAIGAKAHLYKFSESTGVYEARMTLDFGGPGYVRSIVLDGKTGKIFVVPAAQAGCVGCPAPLKIEVVSASTFTVQAKWPFIGSLYAAALSPDSSTLYATGFGAHRKGVLYAFNTGTGSVAKSTTLPGDAGSSTIPFALQLNAAGTRAFVATGTIVWSVNLATFTAKVLHTNSSSDLIDSIALSQSQNVLYVQSRYHMRGLPTGTGGQVSDTPPPARMEYFEISNSLDRSRILALTYNGGNYFGVIFNQATQSLETPFGVQSATDVAVNAGGTLGLTWVSQQAFNTVDAYALPGGTHAFTLNVAPYYPTAVTAQ